MSENPERSYSFTLRGSHLMAETVNSASFQEMDAEMIFDALRNQFAPAPFCAYLKRYLYLKANMTGSYRAVPFHVYYTTLMDAFLISGTPASMKRGKSRLDNRVRSWLQQSAADRNTVLLLGFALSMPTEDVNHFLTGAIHERKLDPDDPLEAVCAYCYDHGYGFPKMEMLMKLYHELETDPDLSRVDETQPAGRPESALQIEQDRALLSGMLAGGTGHTTPAKLRTEKHFHRLYAEACAAIQTSAHSPAPVPPHVLEDILCASIPRNRHGNLIPRMNSSLREEISGRRMSRQRLHTLLHGGAEPSRFDLITLQFLVSSVSAAYPADPKKRFDAFVQETNRVLQDCGFGGLYTASPYECFLMMCVLSLDPLGTYADVLEMAYSGAGTEAPA